MSSVANVIATPTSAEIAEQLAQAEARFRAIGQEAGSLSEQITNAAVRGDVQSVTELHARGFALPIEMAEVEEEVLRLRVIQVQAEIAEVDAEIPGVRAELRQLEEKLAAIEDRMRPVRSRYDSLLARSAALVNQELRDRTADLERFQARARVQAT